MHGNLLPPRVAKYKEIEHCSLPRFAELKGDNSIYIKSSHLTPHVRSSVAAFSCRVKSFLLVHHSAVVRSPLHWRAAKRTTSQ